MKRSKKITIGMITPGVSIPSFSILQNLFHYCLSAHYMPIYLHSYDQALFPGDSPILELLLATNTSFYILELTIEIESNIQINSDRKGKSSDPLLPLLGDLKFDKP